MIKKYIISHWPIITILILAAFLRLYRIGDYMEFLGDQGRDVYIIRDLFRHGNLFFIGPQTSIGNMYLGPYFYYLIAPALLIGNFNPIAPAVFIAMLNLATVYLVFFVGQKWFNRSTGLISSFLFAISPVVIKYSNFIWNPNIMPLFALLFMYFFIEAIHQKKYQYFTWASVAFIFVINSHYLGLALLPVPGIYWFYRLIKLIQSKSPDLKKFLINSIIALTIFLLSLTPQILFDLKHDGQNFKALVTFFTYRETTVNIKPYKAIPELPGIFTQVATDLISGRDPTAGIIISSIFALILIIYLFKTKAKNYYFWFISGWYFSGLVALALYKQHIYAHYFAFLFPAIFLLIALLINKHKILGIPLLLAIAYFSLTNNPFRWSPNQQLATTQQIAQSIIQKSAGKSYNFSLLAKQNYDPPYRYLLTQKNETKLVTLHQQITDQLFVVCEPFQIDCNPINNPEWSIAAFGWAKIEDEWDINGIKLYKLIHTQ